MKSEVNLKNVTVNVWSEMIMPELKHLELYNVSIKKENGVISIKGNGDNSYIVYKKEKMKLKKDEKLCL